MTMNTIRDRAMTLNKIITERTVPEDELILAYCELGIMSRNVQDMAISLRKIEDIFREKIYQRGKVT